MSVCTYIYIYICIPAGGAGSKVLFENRWLGVLFGRLIIHEYVLFDRLSVFNEQSNG